MSTSSTQQAVSTPGGQIPTQCAADTEPRHGTSQYLTFMLDDHEYAIDILKVQEIRGWDSATPIPGTPGYIRGAVNVRGAIVPLLDLRQRFGLASIPDGPTTVVIMVRVRDEVHERTVGIVVDAVSTVHDIAPAALQAAADLGGAVREEFVTGLATVDGHMVIVLEIDRLVNSSIAADTAAAVH